MLVVGLTGGISTGKSTVSNLLKQRGVPVIDADILAREVVMPGTPGLRAIVSEFGTEVLQEDGSLDRPKLGSIIFNDERKRKKLNAIVHPAVRKAMVWAVLKHWLKGDRACVLDVPLLIESGIWRWVGKVVVVYCSQEIQLRRLQERDGSTREAAQSRVKAQMPITDKLDYADQVLDNSGRPADLEPQVDALVRRIHRETEWSSKLDLFPPFGLVSAVLTLFWRRVKYARRTRRKRSKANSASNATPTS